MTFFDNELTIEIHEAPNWKTALLQHSALAGQVQEEIPDNLSDAKDYFSDGDCLIDVIPVPTHQVIKL